MAFVLNDPDGFRDDSRRGMVLAHPELLREASGGMMCATEPDAPQVAVVIGGGSGHYPAFAGFVGPGLADAAAMGEVFASPSARAVESVALAVEAGRGVLLSFGNYAGDVMNFERAAGLLRARGIPVELVPVTDDVASAPVEQWQTRRGIAGDLLVFKVAGAAAARGADLAEVARLARRANAVTRTVGVAFGGATLPGAEQPLFTVPDRQMALGMGIHGEPGLETLPLTSADELASRLWSRLRDEVAGAGAGHLVVVVNGLGAVKGEELYLFYGALHALLQREGHPVAEAQIGEFATSFEMPGLSVTVATLDDELFELWTAPALSAAFSRGAVAARSRQREVRTIEDRRTVAAEGGGSARQVVAAFERIAAVIAENEGVLGVLDAIAGDGDHGIGMRHGSDGALRAARESHEQGRGARAAVIAAGDGWEDAAGGSSGAIWGAIWRAVGEPGFDPDGLDVSAVDSLLQAMLGALASFGAQPGDRTMLDAALGLVAGWRGSDENSPLSSRWRAAVQASTDAAVATAAMIPRTGRARSHAAKPLDTPDPGAVSFALVAGALTNR
jgi:dihydroxyacetone kinase